MTDSTTYTFGLDTFGDRNGDADGVPVSHAQTIRNVVEEGVFAEEAGVDFFGIGKHHTEEFPMPAGDVALAAIAARTSWIRLGSAVTVLSSDDPVRVFQRYSTLNAISAGRRSHPRPRLKHRLVPAVRLRPRRLRAALRREGDAVRRTAQRRPGYLGGQDPGVPGEPERGPAHRVRAVSHLDRGRREPGVCGARRPPWLRAGAGDHRRPPGQVRAVL